MEVAFEQETELWGYDLTLTQPPVASQCDWACSSESTFVLGNVYYCLEMFPFKEWIMFIFNLKCSMHPPLSLASYHCLCHVCSHNRLGLWLFYSHLLQRHFEWNNSDGAGHFKGEWGFVCLLFVKEADINLFFCCKPCAAAFHILLQHFQVL